MLKKKVIALNINGKEVKGKVLLVYNDALASGNKDYVPVTFLSVVDKDGVVHEVRPRDVKQVLKKKKKGED